MDRDPENRDCTRDPIFILQAGFYRLHRPLSWITAHDDCMYTTEDRPEWVDDFVDEAGEIESAVSFFQEAISHEVDGYPVAEIVWNPELVFLTRKEAEDYAEERAYRWQTYQVYCIPCKGALARILRDYQPPGSSQGSDCEA